MPRRYRPPTTRRRKAKKEGTAWDSITVPEDRIAVPVPASSPRPAEQLRRQDASTEERHIARDHSYVLVDLKRVGLIVGFIIGGLVITAILR